MKIGPIKKWLTEKEGTFAWQRVLISSLPQLREEGFFLHTITDESEISTTTLLKIKEKIQQTFNLELPIEELK